MVSKVQLILFALSAFIYKDVNSACCGSTVGLQQVRFGYPRYEGCACSPCTSLYSGPCSLTSCGCGTSSCGCGTSSCGCGTSSCGCGTSSCGCGADSSVCACFKKLNCDKDCGCGPRVYFPEVEYPVTVIDALGPFYFGSCVC